MVWRRSGAAREQSNNLCFRATFFTQASCYQKGEPRNSLVVFRIHAAIYSRSQLGNESVCVRQGSYRHSGQFRQSGRQVGGVEGLLGLGSTSGGRRVEEAVEGRARGRVDTGHRDGYLRESKRLRYDRYGSYRLVRVRYLVIN